MQRNTSLDQQKTPYLVDVSLTYILSVNQSTSIDITGFSAHLIMTNSDL
ncbi:hypothetical protein [Providencia rettgeri]|nr:hypothetical protein [Providencia rettgeri]QXA56537.1 hypothetical protein I6L79_14100 [Providencia rettgeri]